MTGEPIQIDPPSLPRSPAFAQGVVAPPGSGLLFVGGQNGVDAEGVLLDGLGPQTDQALRNVIAVLEAAGTSPDHVLRMTIYLAPDVDPTAAYAASQSVWGARRTAVTVLAVAPANPGALVEIDAVAVVPAS